MYIWVIVCLGSRRLLFWWVIVLGLYLLSLFRLTMLGAFVLLFANTMNARTRVNIIVDGPVRTLPTVRERPGDFLEAWI